MQLGKKLSAWVEEIEQLTEPDSIHICDGSKEESLQLSLDLVKKKTFISLKRENCFLARSDPRDVARVEERTFICSQTKEEAGPTNHWVDPKEMKKKLTFLFQGSMKGRTLYVIPFSMGPIGSEIAHIGVQITDSPYVVINMQIMTRMGKEVLEQLKEKEFVKCLHSVGYPLNNRVDIPWPCDPENVHIAHFPETREVWSYGSGYGGNALLGKKCFALRIASSMAKQEGWLAEHMLIVGVTNPEGKKRYFAAAFPSACGKTNMAMLTSTLPNWKVECVGDDIAWMKIGADGKLYAINPEFGFFGVAPGTSISSNPNALKCCEKNTIFTNTALTEDFDVWWEKLSDPPSHLIDWKGEDWTPAKKKPAAHPNSRFTAPLQQCPVLDPAWNDPQGVPISGIIFGGRRKDTIPLVMEASSWEHGVLMGASLSSETTAAAEGPTGALRHDPFAMLPFCGYNMGDYFSHWLSFINLTDPKNLPRIYTVNWFLKDAQDQFIWPGYGDNIRVLKWIFDRLENKVGAEKHIVGLLPHAKDLDCHSLLSSEKIQSLLHIDPSKWKEEIEKLELYFQKFGSSLPSIFSKQLEQMKTNL